MLTLRKAVIRGDMEIVVESMNGRQLLDNGKSHELLKIALTTGNLDIYHLLVSRGASTANFEKFERSSLLHLLAKLKSEPTLFDREIKMYRAAVQLLASGLNVIHVNERHETPIHVAAKYKNARVLYLLVDELMKKPERFSNVTDHDGLSLFHVLCTMPHKEYAVAFYHSVKPIDIEHAVSLDSKFYAGYTALHFAAAHYRFGVFQFLTSLGANGKAVTATRQTALHLACSMDHPVWMFHEISRAIPSHFTENWASYVLENLSFVLRMRNQLTEAILALDVHVNARDVYDHNAMFYIASANYFSSHQAVVPLSMSLKLEKEVAEVNYFAWLKLQEHQMYLLTNLYRRNLQQTRKRALIFESKYFYELAEDRNPDLTYDMVQFLLDLNDTGANVCNSRFVTPLHAAAENKKLMVLKSFVEFYDTDYDKMANVNQLDILGNTPLHYIDPVDTGDYNSVMITLLLRYGADINVKSDDGTNNCEVLYDFACNISCLDDFDKVADEEEDLIVEALACKTDISSIECHSWLETMITIWKYLIMLEACEAPLEVVHYGLMTEVGDSILISDRCKDSSLMFKKACNEEVKHLKQLHISKFVCLNDVLTKDIHMVGAFTRNIVLTNTLKSAMFTKLFPIYSNVLRARYIRARMRRQMAHEAAVSLQNLINPDIPSACAHKILSYLDDRTLFQVKIAGKKAVKVEPVVAMNEPIEPAVIKGESMDSVVMKDEPMEPAENKDESMDCSE